MLKKLIYTIIFLAMLFEFIIPKDLLKIALTQKANDALQAQHIPISIMIQNISPTFGIGLTLQGIQLTDLKSTHSSPLLIEEATISFSPFALLWGEWKIKLQIKKEGYLQTALGMSFHNQDISSLQFNAQNFPIDHFFNFFRGIEIENTNIIQNLFKIINLQGFLNGSIDLQKGPKDLPSGIIYLSLKDLIVGFKDPTFFIGKQSFSKSILNIELENNQIKILPNTHLISNDMDLEFNGNITANSAPPSQWDMRTKASLKLSPALEKELAPLLISLLNCKKASFEQGELRINLQGQLKAPICEPSK